MIGSRFDADSRSGRTFPHPAIGSRSVREATFEFDRPMTLLVDGLDVGTVPYAVGTGSTRRRRIAYA